MFSTKLLEFMFFRITSIHDWSLTLTKYKYDENFTIKIFFYPIYQILLCADHLSLVLNIKS